MTCVEEASSDPAELADPLCEASCPPIVVIKFGGTSLGTPARISLAALRVKEQLRVGFLPVVVVSARGRTTDRLLRDLRAVCRGNGDIPPAAQREVDRALATGETLAAALLALAITALGLRAESVSANEAVLLATGPHGAANLHQLRPGRVARLLENGIVPVVAGFQGVRDDGEVVTLGRGSSDITAVFLAAELGAVACHIVTDVDGVYEDDPRISPASPRYPALTFEQLVEITERGARVVHPQAARAAFFDSIPLHIYHYGSEVDRPDGTFVGHVQ